MLLLVFVVEMYLYLHEFMEIIFSSDGMLAVHFTPCTMLIFISMLPFARLSNISPHFIPMMLKFELTWETLGISKRHKIL